MKKIYITIHLLVMMTLTQQAYSQMDSLSFGGMQRSYIVHLPPQYTAGSNLPLVINMHGYTSNGAQQQGYSVMNAVADAEGFIVVYPYGTGALLAWNSFYYTGVDDVGFISTLIDQLHADFNVDLTRVYACGMSNGGFQSHRLACELEGKIAAIASVTGLLSPTIMANCDHEVEIPVLQIHGTNDVTVPYSGGTGGSVQGTVDFWVQHNGLNATPVTENLPDINPGDGSTITKYTYSKTGSDVKVVLMKVNNGGHTWPGALIDIPNLVTNRDINASQEIWNFFKDYQLQSTTGIGNDKPKKVAQNVKYYPNPFRNNISVETESIIRRVSIYNVIGTLVKDVKGNQNKQMTLETSMLADGVYFLHVETAAGLSTYRIVK